MNRREEGGTTDRQTEESSREREGQKETGTKAETKGRKKEGTE